MLKIQKVPIVGGETPTSHTLPQSGASRRHILDSYENTDFFLGGGGQITDF